ncbi:unnamed protein product [Vitrella brassicaformis CCMP3155]|uniref:Uncharacterized protein n=1 Tax=Vitrella brassicaformis (strain CCMP3155) TaxID=1169540 RepID=A0A0G4GHX6_VITBC|nr:unnamed protein product [Vitrella brassicaformis CCMP3155]|eukprot:CEM29328.1 unnamed protein product [Vitrella brassicaformis CCMP3155]
MRVTRFLPFLGSVQGCFWHPCVSSLFRLSAFHNTIWLLFAPRCRIAFRSGALYIHSLWRVICFCRSSASLAAAVPCLVNAHSAHWLSSLYDRHCMTDLHA